ncbi:MAG TPA: hypothetical protein VMN36_10155 [Verrucomicrobiales bacterium]|nr:hypothetical protein [Verrucomicrobiales bacterium]
MKRLLLVSGLLAASMGAAWLIPAVAEWLSRGSLDRQDYTVSSAGLILLLGGVIAIWRGLPAPRLGSIPAPVRAVIAANGLFLSFMPATGTFPQT